MGAVGCGKSSLIGTILGETVKISGSRNVAGMNFIHFNVSFNLGFKGQ